MPCGVPVSLTSLWLEDLAAHQSFFADEEVDEERRLRRLFLFFFFFSRFLFRERDFSSELACESTEEAQQADVSLVAPRLTVSVNTVCNEHGVVSCRRRPRGQRANYR